MAAKKNSRKAAAKKKSGKAISLKKRKKIARVPSPKAKKHRPAKSKKKASRPAKPAKLKLKKLLPEKIAKAPKPGKLSDKAEVIRDEELKQILVQEHALEAPQERRKRKREPEEIGGGDDNASEHTLDRTPMKIYLSQIEAIPLLTPEQEIELAQKVHGRDAHAAEKARHQMIRSNLRLVISIAKRYSNMGLAFSDLVEEGNIGLMRAVEKFNPDRGYRFSTYASWWIKQAIMRALSNQGKTIRIPVYMYDIISKWRKVRDGLMQKLNRLPTAKEIAEIMKVPRAKIEEIEKIASRPSSLNAPISLDGTAELVDLLPDDESHSPESHMEELFKNSRIKEFLDQLDERERRILTQRFGLGRDEPKTLEEVAQEFNITRERVRQIENVAIKKIRERMEAGSEKLTDYVEP